MVITKVTMGGDKYTVDTINTCAPANTESIYTNMGQCKMGQCKTYSIKMLSQML